MVRPSRSLRPESETLHCPPSPRIHAAACGVALIAMIGLAGCGRDGPTAARLPLAPHTPAPQQTTEAIAPPVLLETFEGNADDVTGNGHDGYVYGFPMYRQSDLDSGLVLDGHVSQVLIPYDQALEPEAVSVELYFKPARELTDHAGFVPLVVKMPSYGNFWNTADGYDLWYQDSGGGGRLGFGIGDAGGTVRVSTSLTGPLSPNLTHHIVGTYGGHELRLYLDGEMVARLPYDHPIAYLQGSIHVGGGIYHSYYGGGPFYAGGVVDEFALYDYVLSPGQVRQRARRVSRRPSSAQRLAAPLQPAHPLDPDPAAR